MARGDWGGSGEWLTELASMETFEVNPDVLALVRVAAKSLFDKHQNEILGLSLNRWRLRIELIHNVSHRDPDVFKLV